MLIKLSIRKRKHGYNGNGKIWTARKVGKHTFRIDLPYSSLSFTKNDINDPFYNIKLIYENNRNKKTRVFKNNFLIKLFKFS